MRVRWLLSSLLLLAAAAPAAALADAAPFDLAGPGLEVEVTHGAATLPISEVPNLAVGDRIAIKAELPPGQAARYLLVVAFLRGATNPPPKTWFHRVETWTRKGAQGLELTTPPGAQQALVFLAPHTGGDFSTLVNAVRGRPGAFVRASQDLEQAALDRSRLDAFLAAVRQQDATDPTRLKTISPMLARSLTIKLDTDCFQKMSELQAACLTQGKDSLVLDDGHSASLAHTLTTGSSADLAFQLGAAATSGVGYYSPYIAAVMDIVRITDSLHTAHYQYIPALATAHGDRLALLLNTPPSFHNPLSVLVATLPAVEPPHPPPLQAVSPKADYCAERGDLVLPVDGAPLAYSTGFAHHMVLRVKTKAGQVVDLPARADAAKGGFVVDTRSFNPGRFGADIDATLAGDWGFTPFDGPSFRLVSGRGAEWRLDAADRDAPVVGRDDVVRLQGPDPACVASVTFDQPPGAPQDAHWSVDAAGALAVVAPLAKAKPGPFTLAVRQYGAAAPQTLALRAYAEPGRLVAFTLHAGDASGVLTGARLDEVAGLTLGGVKFAPAGMTSQGGADALTLTAADATAAEALASGWKATATVALKDGRTHRLDVVVAPPRPEVALIGKSIEPAAPRSKLAIRLGSADELPRDARITFSVRALPPLTLDDHTAIEVAAPDGGGTVTLTPASGLTLEDAQVAVASLDADKAFGASTFGPLRFRVVENGVAGDWRPLATLVRLPTLSALRCGGRRGGACELRGDDLFLIDSVAADPGFERAAQAPEGFTGDALETPRPHDGRLYLKLRDDPSVVDVLVVPTPPDRAEAERHGHKPRVEAKAQERAAGEAHASSGGSMSPQPPVAAL